MLTLQDRNSAHHDAGIPLHTCVLTSVEHAMHVIGDKKSDNCNCLDMTDSDMCRGPGCDFFPHPVLGYSFGFVLSVITFVGSEPTSFPY